MNPFQCLGALNRSLERLSEVLEEHGLLESHADLNKAFAIVAQDCELLDQSLFETLSVAINHEKLKLIAADEHDRYMKLPVALREEEIGISPERLAKENQ